MKIGESVTVLSYENLSLVRLCFRNGTVISFDDKKAIVKFDGFFSSSIESVDLRYCIDRFDLNAALTKYQEDKKEKC